MVYRGNDPSASGIILPKGTWKVSVEAEDARQMRNSALLGTFTLVSPPTIDAHALQSEVQHLITLSRLGDSQGAVAGASLVA